MIIGIESQELLLTIRDTNLKELPIGFYKVFKNVVHLSFDLRNNQFETLSADVFYNTSEQSWEQTGTKAIKGTIGLFYSKRLHILIKELLFTLYILY